MTAALRALGVAAGVAFATWVSTATALAESLANPVAASTEQTLSRCLGSTNRLEVLFLIDRSGSLQTSDPDAQRVGGIKSALSALAQLTEGSPGRAQLVIDVLFASFAGTVIPDPFGRDAAASWAPLTAATAASLDRAADAYTTDDDAYNTDYLLALRSAGELFAQRDVELTRSGGPSPCKLLVWFTDGGYLIRDAPQRVAAGRHELCRPGGVADGLVGDGVVMLTIGLRSSSFDDRDADHLRALTEGTGGSEHCGRAPSPATGSYATADDADELFIKLGDLVSDPTPPARPRVCPRIRTPDCIVRFPIAGGITAITLRATTGQAGIELDLAGPSSTPITMKPGLNGSAEVGGTTIAWTWSSPTSVRVTGTVKRAAEAVGEWSLAFIDPDGRRPDARPDYRLQLVADLVPDLATRSLARGRTTQLAFTTTDDAGRPVTGGALLEQATLDVTFSDPVTKQTARAAVRARGPGAFAAAIPVSPDSPSSYQNIDADLRFATQPGVAIVARHRTYTLPIPPDAGFPVITPARLDFRSIDGEGSATRVLTVRGSDVAGGCVRFGTGRASAPDGGRVTLSVPARLRTGCVHVDRGRSIRIAVVARVTTAFSGRAALTLPVELTSDAKAGTRPLVLAGGVSAHKPPDERLLWLVLSALLVVAIGIPLAALAILNRRTARFTERERVQALALDVRVRDDGSLVELAASGEREPDVRARAFDLLAAGPRTRRPASLEIDDDFELRAYGSFGPRRKPAGLFLGPYGVARVAGRRVMAGTDASLPRYGDAAQVPLALPGSWLFSPTRRNTGEGSEPYIDGRLVLLVSGRRGDEAAEVLDAARRAIVALLLEPAHEPAPASESQPSRRTRPVTRLRRVRFAGDAGPTPLPDDDIALASGRFRTDLLNEAHRGDLHP